MGEQIERGNNLRKSIIIYKNGINYFFMYIWSSQLRVIVGLQKVYNLPPVLGMLRPASLD